MQVIERDAAGKPIPNVQVTWTTDSGYGGYQVTNQTDTKGYAMLQLTGRTDVSFSGSPTLPTKVTATDSLGNIVNFVFTTAAAQLLDGTSFPAPTVVEYSSLDENGVPVPQFPKGRVIKAAAGSLIKGAYFARIVLTAGAFVGQGIQGVGVCFTNNDPEGRDETPGPVPSGSTYCGQLPTNSGPGANCEGSPISDAGGLVTCDLRIGPALGTTSIYPRIGEFKTLQPIVLTVTTGPASLITSFSGDKQTAKPGAALPLPLGVRVTDLAGNNLSGVPITWSQILGTGAKLSATTSTTTINGQASINVTLPTTPGPIKIQATVSSTLFLQFDATVDAQVGGITVVSGDNQKAFPGQAFASPLVVLVKNQSGLPLPNTQVNFATAGPGVLSSATATTGADGTASTKLTAGNSTGAVVVTAIVGSFQASFGNLSVISQGPVISITSFLNAASFQPGISPCGLAVVQGTGLAPGVSGTLAPTGFGPNPTSLGPVQGLTIGGVAAPLTSVSNNSGVERVGFQVPCEVPVGSTTAIMTVNGGATTVPGVAISQYSPGMFETFASDGRSYAVALRSDGSFVGPANPAIRGETVRLFGTGAGQTTPAIGTNRAGTGGQSVNADLIVSLNTIGIFVVKSEYVAGQIGTYFVDIQIPMDSVSDPYLPISFGVTPPGGGVAKFSNNVYIPIQ